MSSDRTALPLITEEISAGDSESFAELYALYADLFPLPDEREPPEAFLEILALNENADAQARFGPWRELIAAIRLGERGPIVGGHIFGVTTSRAHVDFGCFASVQGIYTFFDRSVRGRSNMREILRYFEARALETFDFEPNSPVRPLIFIEVNNPLRMSADEIATDTRSSGVNPYRRYTFWLRSGFRPLDFAYIQPRLRPEAQPVRYLDLFCSGTAAEIPSALVMNHLRAFISISVLKGNAADTDEDFRAMRTWLDRHPAVGFVAAERADQRTIRERTRSATN